HREIGTLRHFNIEPPANYRYYKVFWVTGAACLLSCARGRSPHNRTGLLLYFHRIQRLTIRTKRLEAHSLAIDFYDPEISGHQDYLGDALEGLVCIIQRRAPATCNKVVDEAFQIVLVVVIVAKESGGNFVLLQHGHESDHVQIVALAAGHGGHWRMVSH